MKYLEVQPAKLHGVTSVQGAKNSALALLPACLLTDQTVHIDNVPTISDVDVVASIFEDLGVTYTREFHSWSIRADQLSQHSIHFEKATKYRASYYFIGATIARLRKLYIGLPGGDDFGSRPIDQHLKGLRALGVRITEQSDGLLLECDRLVGADIYFDVITSGATMNVIMAAALAKGESHLYNAARDPEVVDLCNLLNKMGAKIIGAGTDNIRIRGVDALHGCTHTVIPDRLIAGTYVIAGIATDGELRVEGIIPEHLSALTQKLIEMNANFEVHEDAISVVGEQHLRATRVRTGMYPQFATDLQQPLSALMLRAAGKSIVTENVYPNRFSHIPQLMKMGAQCERKGATAFIKGAHPLFGADVYATDVRAGFALLITALMSEGTTRIYEIEHMERGFDDLVGRFNRLGAKLRIVEQFNMPRPCKLPQIG